MLLLGAPTRRLHDVGISLRAPAGCKATADAVAMMARKTNCPAAVAEKVRACILHSGRYDCRISAAAAFSLGIILKSSRTPVATMTLTEIDQAATAQAIIE